MGASLTMGHLLYSSFRQATSSLNLVLIHHPSSRITRDEPQAIPLLTHSQMKKLIHTLETWPSKQEHPSVRVSRLRAHLKWAGYWNQSTCQWLLAGGGECSCASKSLQSEGDSTVTD